MSQDRLTPKNLKQAQALGKYIKDVVRLIRGKKQRMLFGRNIARGTKRHLEGFNPPKLMALKKRLYNEQGRKCKICKKIKSYEELKRHRLIPELGYQEPGNVVLLCEECHTKPKTHERR